MAMDENDPEPRSELDAEGIPDLEGPLPSKQMTGDPQEGVPPPSDRPAALDYGTTEAEQATDEPLYRRVRRENPDFGQPGAPLDGWLEDEVAGHLVEPDEGVGPDLEEDLVAERMDDESSLSPEEAAVHLEEEA
jgi:hypothetical protein